MDLWNRVTEKVGTINIEEMQGKSIVLFGAGRVGFSAYEHIVNDGYRVTAFADNNVNKWRDEKINEIPIISPECIQENAVVIITVQASNYNYIKHQLSMIHAKYYTYAEYVIRKKFDKFEYVYNNLLSDDCSKMVYCKLMLAYLEGDISLLREIYTSEQYFAPYEMKKINKDEVFMDIGAYVGDTVEQFIWKRSAIFKAIIAFEPVRTTYKALMTRMKRLEREWAIEEGKIRIIQMAVGNQNGMVGFSNKNLAPECRMALSNEEHACEIQVTTLDDFVKSQSIQPTFVKADIEGEEKNLILGAKETVSLYKPLLAICVYHNVDDLYEIPILINSINNEYRMKLMHHGTVFSETVLYCY